ncbi:YbhB/YbcL family Raf kinase inhibitor-like protein [Candidatus Woesearchaeota archaeon]|nr:YbhB/YbcL family Raf kinase inhibitor-like protein [Candidatus Woesearchaeota archaeon]
MTEREYVGPQIDAKEIQGDAAMRLTSTAFQHEETIPIKYTCQGEDINPQLSWDGVPEATRSFALIMDDPDAPMGTWIHWLVKDIPATAREIKENSIPGTEVINSFKRGAYGGPCPPSGTHRYFFKLYALDVDRLDADNSQDFYAQVEVHKIEEIVLMGTYQKT